MKFSPKYRTKKLGIIYTILGSFCSFLNWEGAVIWPQIRPKKIPAYPGIQIRMFNEIFLFLNQNICCRYSKEPS